jgi:transposase
MAHNCSHQAASKIYRKANKINDLILSQTLIFWTAGVWCDSVFLHYWWRLFMDRSQVKMCQVKMCQVEMFTTLDDLVRMDHPYRRFETVVDFDVLAAPLKSLYADQGRPEIGAERAFRILVLQFLEDPSDREMERFMRENLAAKWRCGFSLSAGLKASGLICEVFTLFVDASHD